MAEGVSRTGISSLIIMTPSPRETHSPGGTRTECDDVRMANPTRRALLAQLAFLGCASRPGGPGPPGTEVPEWRFAIGAVVALVHDVLITIGLFSIFQIDFSLAVLAAVLAVIGYSLNDTIVVFDRSRENFRKSRRGTAIEIMNRSINQTLRRTVLTSLTTLLVVLTLLLFGGELIWGFAFALLIGVLVGTYSSIFVASPVVLALRISREDMVLEDQSG